MFSPEVILAADYLAAANGNHSATERNAWKAWYSSSAAAGGRNRAYAEVAIEISEQYHNVPWSGCR